MSDSILEAETSDRPETGIYSNLDNNAVVLSVVGKLCSSNPEIWEVEVTLNGITNIVSLPRSFGTDTEEDIRWYLEDFASDKGSPYETARAQRCAHDIQEYAYSLHQKLGLDSLDVANTSSVLIDIEHHETAIDFYRLNWEGLESPFLWPEQFKVAVRRLVRPLSAKVLLPEQDAPLNILLVVSRPDFEHDVDYRLISKRIFRQMSSLSNSQRKITIELVRPGTWHAFQEHIKLRTEQHGKGYFKLVHFDVHGSMSNANGSFRLNFLRKSGNGTVQVSAEAVAKCLIDHDVPAVVLNACESAKSSLHSNGNFARSLLRAGLSMVLGLSYKGLSSATSNFIAEVYGKFLVEQAEWYDCARIGRLCLRLDPTRPARFGLQVDVEDWMVPVLYTDGSIWFPEQHRGLGADFGERVRNLIPLIATFAKTFISASEESFAPRLDPTIELVGRDTNLLRLETTILIDQSVAPGKLTKRRIIYLHGPAGSGKTSFADSVSRWWTTTNFVQKCFYFDFARLDWDRSVSGIVSSILTSTGIDCAATAEENLSQVLKLLTKERHLLILDSLETTSGSAAVLTQDEKTRIVSLLTQLADGDSICLLCSRRLAENWIVLPQGRVYPMAIAGLTAPSANRLARLVLDTYTYDQKPYPYTDAESSSYLERILAYLDYLPLAIEVFMGSAANNEISPKALYEKIMVGGIIPVAPTHLLDKIRAINDFGDGVIKRLGAEETAGNSLSKAMLNLLMYLSPFRGYLPLDLDRYLAYLIMRGVFWAKIPEFLAELVGKEHLDRALTVYDPKTSEWLDPFMEIRKASLKSLIRLLVDAGAIWPVTTPVIDSNISCHHWRLHPLFQNMIRYFYSHWVSQTLAQGSEEMQMQMRISFCDFYIRRIVWDWLSVASTDFPRIHEEMLCEWESILTAMKFCMDAKDFDRLRVLLLIAVQFDLNTLSRLKFLALTEILESIVLYFDSLEDLREHLEAPQTIPGLFAASVLQNIYFASDTWPLARRFNKYVFRFLHEAAKFREWSPAEEAEHAQAQLCAAWEAYHCGRPEEAEVVFRAQLACKEISAEFSSQDSSYSKLRYLNTLGLLRCRVDDPRSTTEEVKSCASDNAEAALAWAKISRSENNQPGFASTDARLGDSAVPLREYWTRYKGVLDAARQGESIEDDLRELTGSAQKLMGPFNSSLSLNTAPRQGTHGYTAGIDISNLSDYASIQRALLEVYSTSLAYQANAATQADWHRKLCDAALQEGLWELALTHNQAWYDLKGEVYDVEADAWTQANYHYRSSYCFRYLQNWAKARDHCAKAIQGAIGANAKTFLIGCYYHAALVNIAATEAGSPMAIEYFCRAAKLAYRDGSYAWKVEKAGYFLQQLVPLYVRCTLIWPTLGRFDSVLEELDLTSFPLLIVRLFGSDMLYENVTEEQWAQMERDLFLGDRN